MSSCRRAADNFASEEPERRSHEGTDPIKLDSRRNGEVHRVHPEKTEGVFEVAK